MYGGKLKHWIQRDYLKNSNVKEIHIYDSDVPDYKKSVDKMNEGNDGRRKGFITHRYEMENYIPMYLVEKEFNLNLKEYSEDWGQDLDIPKVLVGKVNNRYSKNSGERENIIKKILNGKVMKDCTYEMIKDMGNDEEIKEWFYAIKTMM